MNGRANRGEPQSSMSGKAGNITHGQANAWGPGQSSLTVWSQSRTEKDRSSVK
jgi:hypothetical protein